MQALQAHRAPARTVVRSNRSSRARVAVVQAKKTADGPSIAIVGVTGAVGQEFLQVCRG
jgi:aspartate-semialdehyde dehydrogenase